MLKMLSIVLKSQWNKLKIHPVEPEFWDDTKISLKEKKRHKIINKKSSICDALLSETPGELTFRINKKLLSFGISVTDEQVMEAIHIAYKYLKLVLEPGGGLKSRKVHVHFCPGVCIATGTRSILQDDRCDF